MKIFEVAGLVNEIDLRRLLEGITEDVSTDAKVYQDKTTGKFIAWVEKGKTLIKQEGNSKEEAVAALQKHLNDKISKALQSSNSKTKRLVLTSSFVKGMLGRQTKDPFYIKLDDSKLYVSEEPESGFFKVEWDVRVSGMWNFIRDVPSSVVSKANLASGIRYEIKKIPGEDNAFSLSYFSEILGSHDKQADIAPMLKIQETGRNLKEFALPGSGDGDSGRWYTDDELADIIGDDWFQDFDVSHDEFNIDTYGEKAKKNLASYANSWFDDKGYNVNVMGVDHNDVDHDLKWYIVGSFQNDNFADKDVEESQVNEIDRRGFLKGMGAAAVAGAAGGAKADWRQDSDIVDRMTGDVTKKFNNVSIDGTVRLVFFTGKGGSFDQQFNIERNVAWKKLYPQPSGRVRVDNGPTVDMSFIIPSNNGSSALLAGSGNVPFGDEMKKLNQYLLSAKEKILIDASNIGGDIIEFRIQPAQNQPQSKQPPQQSAQPQKSAPQEIKLNLKPNRQVGDIITVHGGPADGKKAKVTQILGPNKEGTGNKGLGVVVESVNQSVTEGASSIEQKIIKLYKQGLSDDEIASRLKIDSDDVKSVLDDYEWVADTTGEGKGVGESNSAVIASTADRLSNKDDGRTAKLRAAGDARREQHLKGRDIAKNDRSSKDAWGNLKERASQLLSAEDRNGVITVIVQAPDGTKKSLANDNPRYINQWLEAKYGLTLPKSIMAKFVNENN